MRRFIARNISALDLQLLFDSIVPEALVVVIPFAIVVGVVDLVVVVIVVEMVVTLPVQICISKSGPMLQVLLLMVTTLRPRPPAPHPNSLNGQYPQPNGCRLPRPPRPP